MSTTNLHLDHHARRVRLRALAVSWLFAPLLVFALALWLLFNAVVCASGRATVLELHICGHAHLLPDSSVLLVLLSLVWLFFTLSTVGQELLGDEKTGGEPLLLRHGRHARHAYRSLDDRHQSIVLFAIEMATWAAVAAIATLVFYTFELAFPLGLLAIAVVVRILLRTARFLTTASSAAKTSRKDG
jgi:hypothetical protein